MKTTKVFSYPVILKGVLLSAALFGLLFLSFYSLAEQSPFQFLQNLQTLQKQGDVNLPVGWLDGEPDNILFDLRVGIPDAIPIYEDTILPMAKMWWGAEDYRIARGLNFLALLYRTLVYNNLGLLYNLIGDYPKARDNYEKAVTLAKSLEALGPNHPNTLIGMQNLAIVYIAMGDYAKAEQFYQEALDALVELKQVELSPFDKMPYRLLGLFEGYREVSLRQNMAQFYGGILGDYDKAERQFQTALTLINKKVSSPHFLKGAIHQGLGWVYQQKGDYTKAKQYYKDASDIYQKLPAWRESHFSVLTLTQRGYLSHLLKDDIEAERLLKQAVAFSEKASKPQRHRAHLIGISNHHLAMFYHKTSEFEQAEAHFQNALNTFKQSLVKNHPMTVVVMQHLAALKFDQGKIKEAVSLALKTQPLSENVLKNILSFGSEHQRLAYQKRSYPSYDLLARVANKTGNAKPLANAILHNKGVVLDSLIEDSQVVGAPKVKEEIQSLKWRLMKLWMTIPKDDAAAKAKPVSQLEQLEMQLKKLESGLARQVGEARQALEIEFQEVQAVLPEGSVLVEFIRYKHFVGLRDTEAYYGAVIIPKTGDPIWVPLGKADALEKKILDYQKMMRCKKDKKNDCQRYDEQAVTQLLQALYQRLWAPIEAKLPKTTVKTVIISPDGELNFVSYATLLTPQNAFLLKNVDLYYVASGRDLLRETQSVEELTMAVYALSDWEGQAAEDYAEDELEDERAGRIRSVDRQAYLNSLQLPLLEGTLTEANELKKMGDANNWRVNTFFDFDATEKRLYLERSPRILHFATHGIFLHPTTERPTPIETVKQSYAPQFFSISGRTNHIGCLGRR